MVAIWPCILVIDCNGTRLEREREREREHVYVCLFSIIHLSINKNLCSGSATKVIGYIYKGR